MSTYYAEMRFRVMNGDGNVPEDLEDHLDAVLDELLDLDEIIEPDYAATLALGKVAFTMAVDAETQDEAQTAFSVCMRTAIHAAEGATPDWEARFANSETGFTIRRQDDMEYA